MLLKEKLIELLTGRPARFSNSIAYQWDALRYHATRKGAVMDLNSDDKKALEQAGFRCADCRGIGYSKHKGRNRYRVELTLSDI